MAGIELQIELLRKLVAHDVKQPLIKLQREVASCREAYERDLAAGLVPRSSRVSSTLTQVLDILASLYSEDDASELSDLARSGADRQEARAELHNFLGTIAENVNDCYVKVRALLSHTTFENLPERSSIFSRLSMLMRSLASMRSVIGDFLQIVVKPYSNGIAIDIREVIRKAVSIKTIREGSTILLNFESASESGLRIHANPYYLLFVFRQIVTNSVKHASQRPVEISITGYERAVVPENLALFFLPAPPPGPVLIFEISDRGDGIAPEILQRLTEALAHDSDEVKSIRNIPDGDGLGIGLQICKQIVGQYSGKIAITGSSHAGTSTSIVLPIQTGGQS